jgi:hypothetical protein
MPERYATTSLSHDDRPLNATHITTTAPNAKAVSVLSRKATRRFTCVSCTLTVVTGCAEAPVSRPQPACSDGAQQHRLILLTILQLVCRGGRSLRRTGPNCHPITQPQRGSAASRYRTQRISRCPELFCNLMAPCKFCPNSSSRSRARHVVVGICDG